MRERLLAVALLLSSLVPSFAVAQTVIGTAYDEGDIAATPTPAGTVSCFDYYSFGSVQAKLAAPVAGTVSGASITFNGTLENANPYPVVDGALYVKVFKSRGAENDGNGPDVVDQFFVQESIAIPADGSAPMSFSWRVPSYARSGDYKLATFFTTSHKFNLLGLSFTDDVIGNVVPFTVLGEQEAGVAFDKASVTVNGEPYHFAAFPPRVSVGEPVTVQATVENTGATTETAEVVWTIYQWDAQRAEHVVQQEQASVPVPAGGSTPVSVTVRDTGYPVYLAVGMLSWQDTKSIIGVRFVREGIDSPRINFPGVMSFPVKADGLNTLFSCLHNANDADIPAGRLELTLTDRSGGTIAEHRYTGSITSAMMGVAAPFTAARDYDYAVLDAKLYHGDELVDETRVIYDCEAIDPATCAPRSPSSSAPFGTAASTVLGILAGISLLLMLIAVAARLKRASSAPQPADQQQ